MDTQIKIEQNLNNQGYILLKNRMDQNLNLNYYKINPHLLSNFNNSIGELEKLIDNYRININSITNKDRRICYI